MGMDARQRADAAFAKKSERAAEASVACAEYQAEQVALNSNMERLRAERWPVKQRKALQRNRRKRQKVEGRFDRWMPLRCQFRI